MLILETYFTNKNYVKISYNIYDRHPSGRAYERIVVIIKNTSLI